MIYQEMPCTIPLIVAIIIMVASAVYTWWRSYVAGAKIVAILIFIGAAFILTYTMEVSSADLQTKIFWDKTQFLSITVIPVLWLIYVLQFTGYEKWMTSRNLLLLTVVPVMLAILAFTNEYHRLIWSSIVLSDKNLPFELGKTYNVGYGLFLVYSYVLILIGIFLLVRMLIRVRHTYYQQSKALLFAVFLPLAGITIFLLGVNPFFDIGPDIFITVVITFIMGWSFAQVRLADVVYVALGTVVESMNDSIVILDLQNCIVNANPSALHLMGCSVSEAIGQSVNHVWPGLSDFLEHIHHEDIDREITIDLGKEQRIYDVQIFPLTDWRNRIISYVVVLHDITRRKQAEEKMKASLEEKEVLLQEIHHRVKNNMQIISSLLNLQTRYVKDIQCREMFRESQNRIQSMALIHEKVYQSEDLSHIDFKEYVQSVVNGLIQSYDVNMNQVTIKIKVEDISLSIDTAMPCGLIINELVSNALKHAFPDRTGEIMVTLRAVDGIIELTVGDNGVGMPDDVDFKNAETLGLQLVTILAEDQLRGDINLDKSKGTVFTITFSANN